MAHGRETAVFAVALAAVAAMAAGPAARDPGSAADGEASPRPIAHSIRTMGTYANVTIVTADSVASARHARAAARVLVRVDSLLSNWTTISEVARVNRVASVGETRVDPELAFVLEASLQAWRESAGAFDITVEPLVRLWGFLGGPRRVPSASEIAEARDRVGAQRIHYDPVARTVRFDGDVRIDLGGIAKGYAVDVAAETLVARGVTDALVDLSGNMRSLGHPAGADRWRIGIRDPRGRRTHFARVTLGDGEGISTSGQYEQFIAQDGKTYGHILDPRTGWPSGGLISVTVISTTALQCDTWDTPLFVLGPEAAKRKAKELLGIGAILVEPGRDGVDIVWVESVLRDRFRLEPGAGAFFRVQYF